MEITSDNGSDILIISRGIKYTIDYMINRYPNAPGKRESPNGGKKQYKLKYHLENMVPVLDSYDLIYTNDNEIYYETDDIKYDNKDEIEKMKKEKKLLKEEIKNKKKSLKILREKIKKQKKTLKKKNNDETKLSDDTKIYPYPDKKNIYISGKTLYVINDSNSNTTQLSYKEYKRLEKKYKFEYREDRNTNTSGCTQFHFG